MAAEVIMPQMGESIAEGTITKWLKKVGDPVKRDEPIFEISTDKVDAEIPSPVAGTLLEIKVAEGQTVAINTVVALIGEAGEKAAAAPAPAAPAPKPEAAPPPPAAAAPTPAPKPEDETRAATRARSGRRSRRGSAASARRAGIRTRRLGDRARVESFEERVRQRSSPLVRKIASEHGVQIGEIEGTGIHSRVTKNDILSYIENRKTGAAAAPAVAGRPVAAPVPASVACAGANRRPRRVPRSRRRTATRSSRCRRSARSPPRT